MHTTDIDLQASLLDLNHYLAQRCQPTLPLAADLCTHMLSNPGKQIRAQVVLLAAQTHGKKYDERALKLAAIIELIHNATLLHDDVIDHAEQRRFSPAAHQLWDNTSAILAGDYLYGLAFDIMTELEHMPLLTHLAKATQRIVQGEMHQHTQKQDLNTSFAQYLDIIGAKTAELFAVAGLCAGLLTHPNTKQQKALKDYGYHLGLAFQMKDDLLDLKPQSQTGKPINQDLKEGKITLPLIKAYERASSEQKAQLEAAICAPDQHLDTLMHILNETQSYKAAQTLLEDTVDKATCALKPLPDTQAKRALVALAQQNQLRER